MAGVAHRPEVDGPFRFYERAGTAPVSCEADLPVAERLGVARRGVPPQWDPPSVTSFSSQGCVPQVQSAAVCAVLGEAPSSRHCAYVMV